ncbi:MAG: choice-of-anchor D domain-containing protein, partial [Planctomycetaceae bacterium]|nr:choice-of-anchor D domain-containing protein [Planctomycetaceae bacterium]
AIEWTPVAGAASYDVFIRQLATGAVTSFSNGSSDAFASSPVNLADGLHRVWVRAVSEGGFRSAWSPAFDLTIGGRTVVTGPSGQSSDLRPTFLWLPVGGAQSYDLIVDRTDTEKRQIDQSGITATQFLSNQELAAGEYRIRVRAISNTGVVGDWSQPLDFTIVAPQVAALQGGEVLPGTVSIDGQWQLDATGGGSAEIDRNYGLAGDQFVTGNWNGAMDQLGVVRQRSDGFLQWYLNTDSAGSPVHEVDFLFGLWGDTAIAGDWDGNGTTNAGVVRTNHITGGLDWYMDLDRDPEPERVQQFGLIGDIPVTGDWDHNGTSDVGVVRKTANGFLEWHLDVDGDAWPEVSRIFGLAGDAPLVGDWDNNGFVDLGVARPNANGQWDWYRDLNGDPIPDLPVVSFGSTTALPVTGRWHFSEFQMSVAGLGGEIPISGDPGQLVSFGTGVEGDAPREVTFMIRNTGTSPLELSQLNLPQGFLVTDPVAALIAPGGLDQLTIQLPTIVPGQYSGEVSLLTSDGNESVVRFRIAGTVESIAPKIDVSDDWQLGEVVSGEEPEARFTIQNTGHSPLQYSAALSGSQFAFVSGETGVIAAGSFGEIVVRLHSSRLGLNSTTLTIHSNAGNVSVPIRRTVSATIVAATPQIAIGGTGSYGSVGLNQTGLLQERVFTITNPGNAPLTYAASVSGSQFVILDGASGTVMPDGGMATIRVQMKTNSTGVKSATLTVQSNATSGSIQTKSLSGTVIPGTPKASVSGDGSFGEVAWKASNASAERTIIVSNTGTASLTIHSTVSNSSFMIVSGGDANILPGKSASVRIRMSVATVGDKTATLTITSNDATSPTQQIALTGTVVATTVGSGTPEVAVQVGSTTLGPGDAGVMNFQAGAATVRQQTFTITNTGSGVLRVTSPLITGEFTHDLPASLSLQQGETRTVTVKMVSNSYGTKLGRLVFATNDSDEGQVSIQLLGRLLPPVKTVSGNAIQPPRGVYT